MLSCCGKRNISDGTNTYIVTDVLFFQYQISCSLISSYMIVVLYDSVACSYIYGIHVTFD